MSRVIRDKNGKIISCNIPDTFVYNNQIYTIGTKVSMKTICDGICSATYVYGNTFITDNGNYVTILLANPYNIIQIINPIYYVESNNNDIIPNQFASHPQNYEDSFYGLLWYILIMVVGSIFSARLLIWIFATVLFLLWKTNK